MVKRAARTDIVTNIRNRDDRVKAAGVGIGGSPNGIVKVACIAWIDSNYRQMAQVFTMVIGNGQFPHALCLAFGRLRHFKRNAIFVNGDKAEAFGCKWVAKYLRDPRRFFVCVARQFGQHKLASFRITNIPNLGVKTPLFVDRL